MNWIIGIFKFFAVINVIWLLLCLVVYSKLGDEIPQDSWHWKWYTWFTSEAPESDCDYIKKLAILPWKATLIAISFVIVVIFILIRAGSCLWYDWLFMPILFGKRVVMKDKSYWDGIIGDQSSKNRYRRKQTYETFFPLSPWIPMAAITILYALSATMIELSRVSFVTASLVLCVVIWYFVRNTPSWIKGFKKWRTSVCKQINTPPIA